MTLIHPLRAASRSPSAVQPGNHWTAHRSQQRAAIRGHQAPGAQLSSPHVGLRERTSGETQVSLGQTGKGDVKDSSKGCPQSGLQAGKEREILCRAWESEPWWREPHASRQLPPPCGCVWEAGVLSEGRDGRRYGAQHGITASLREMPPSPSFTSPRAPARGVTWG